MLGHCRIALQRVHDPLARGGRVGHGLQRGEGLGREDEEGLRRIEIVGRVGKGRAIDIGDEAERHLRIGKVAQRDVGHLRPQIRSADADVDHVLDGLAGVALPLAAAHAIGKGRHLVEHCVHVGDNVFAVDLDLGSARERAAPRAAPRASP